MAQQGFPPGRHSRGPYPGEAPYADEYPQPDGMPDADEYPQRDDVQYADELPSRSGAPYSDESAHRADAPPGRGGRPDRDVRAPRPGRSRRLDRQAPGPAWQEADPFGPAPGTDTDVPPWAYPGRPITTARRPAVPRRDDDSGRSRPADVEHQDASQVPVAAEEQTRAGRRRGRAAAARLRKSRRRVYRWCGAAIAACVIAAGIVAIVTHHAPKPAPYVTSLQRGEFKSVPAACGSVSAALLNQFLPGSGRTTTNQLSTSTDSQCSFTIDTKPNFLVLEVQAQSYPPFAAAGRDGSATGNAQDNFGLAEQGLAHPPKKAPLPPAQISRVPGLGQQAFMSFQSAHVTGIVTDIVTVVVRERNVVITVSLSGQESGHGFGPVPVSTLQAGARAAAASALAKVMAQPTA